VGRRGFGRLRRHVSAVSRFSFGIFYAPEAGFKEPTHSRETARSAMNGIATLNVMLRY
jgi:hypothetical protein